MSDVQDILIKVEPEKLEALAGRVNSKIEAIRGRFERIESLLERRGRRDSPKSLPTVERRNRRKSGKF